MTSVYYILFFTSLLIMELLYFRVARIFKILDHPNTRSLHAQPTIRGGGIIFYLSAVLFYGITQRPSLFFIVALTLVSVVGFIDDVRSLSSLVRLLVQCLAFSLVLIDMDLSDFGYVMIGVVFVFSVGALNTFNFMDGINGITGGYGLVAFGTLFFINVNTVHFIDSDFLVAVIMSVVVFGIFNFRTNALCFAGDVGSMALGFIIIYLIVKLVVVSDNYAYAFLLSVYGVDSVLTIIQRLMRKENIFKPHKLHLFQVTVNYFNIPHLRMSSYYSIVQLGINVLIVMSVTLGLRYQFMTGVALVLLLAGVYMFIKLKLIKTVPSL